MESKQIDVPALIAWLEGCNAELKAKFGIDDKIYQPLEVDLLTLIRTAKAHQPDNAHASGGENIWLWYCHGSNPILTLTAHIP